MWLWTTAAAASRHASASAAISSGETGMWGFRRLSVTPLIAASMTTGISCIDGPSSRADPTAALAERAIAALAPRLRGRERRGARRSRAMLAVVSTGSDDIVAVGGNLEPETL